MKKVMISIGIALALILIGIGIANLYLNKMHYIKIDKSDKALGITDVTPSSIIASTGAGIDTITKPGIAVITTDNSINVDNPENKIKVQSNKVTNIALFGVDRTSEKGNGRSDSTMVLTIDYAHKKLKITSFMRDLYVHVDGHGYTKLTHAYAYGGPQLAIKTLNENFGLDIREYCTVDFFSLEKIIDEIGGVKIDVKKNEIKYINGGVAQVADIEKRKPDMVTKSGIQLLSGAQAVSYSRIRYTGHGDFDRTERQRTVLINLIGEAKAKGTKDLYLLTLRLLPLVETSMSRTEIMSLCLSYFKQPHFKLEEERIPVDGFWKSDMSTGIYYLKTDLSVSKKQVMQYVYNDIKPVERKK